jgi:hypothetical protein
VVGNVTTRAKGLKDLFAELGGYARALVFDQQHAAVVLSI